MPIILVRVDPNNRVEDREDLAKVQTASMGFPSYFAQGLGTQSAFIRQMCLERYQVERPYSGRWAVVQ